MPTTRRAGCSSELSAPADVLCEAPKEALTGPRLVVPLPDDLMQERRQLERVAEAVLVEEGHAEQGLGPIADHLADVLGPARIFLHVCNGQGLAAQGYPACDPVAERDTHVLHLLGPSPQRDLEIELLSLL